ncbi:hypothetical protein GCM10018785_71500 [Streptomyces longispororuber]|uniref:Secreted protein n=1 Tax=Streptomyces longispororuber TaxID=68230 RepID=A0A919AAU6_9ACTN|nr:hypothetical protein [Streptomyces longispororuber]GHE96224.1 hypothetical protein GCM10018785_71500 [Streptomyces longispororuber]
MNLRTQIALATATVALGSGLAVTAPAAQAQPPSQPNSTTVVDGQNQAAARWHQIWAGRHGPANKWSTHDFTPHTRNLSVHFGCYGHDGAKLRAELVRTRDKRVIKRSGSGFCADGRTQFLNATVSGGTSYYLRLQFTRGPKHSMYARVYDKH